MVGAFNIVYCFDVDNHALNITIQYVTLLAERFFSDQLVAFHSKEDIGRNIVNMNQLVVQRERLLCDETVHRTVSLHALATGEIGRIDALLKTLDGQQDRLEERLEVLASQVPEDEEPMNTTVVDEVGSTQVITSEMDEAAFLRSQIVEIRRRKDGLYAERAEHANTEVQIKNNKVTISWKKIRKNKKTKSLLGKIKRIQVQYSTDPEFKQNVVTKSYKKNKRKVTLKLGKKTTYYIRIRYVGTDGVSAWSEVKRVTTK